MAMECQRNEQIDQITQSHHSALDFSEISIFHVYLNEGPAGIDSLDFVV